MTSLILAIVFGTVAPLIVTLVLSIVANHSRKKEICMDAVSFIVRESKAIVGVGIVLMLIGCAILSGIIYLMEPRFWTAVYEAGTVFSIFMYLGFVFIGALVLILFLGWGWEVLESTVIIIDG